MTTADPITVGPWTTHPELTHPDTEAGEYVGRHRKPGDAYRRAPFTLRRLFYVARHRRR